MGGVLNGLLAAANQDPKLTRVFSTFSATTPSIFLDIDRDKAQALGLSVNDVFTTLQATLGGIYINDFNLFGRTWQVNIQGEAADRTDIPAIWRIYIRNKTGTMVPLRSIADARIVLGPQTISRYNNYRSITVNGTPKPGVSSGDALNAMQALSDKTLPNAYGFEWTGTAFQEKQGRRPDRLHPRPRRALRLFVPGRPLRELGHPHPRPALRHRRRARLLHRPADRRPVARPLCADRPRQC